MIKLLQGDCLELMKDIPDKSIDLILTDPPYLISKKSGFNSGGSWNNAQDKKFQKHRLKQILVNGTKKKLTFLQSLRNFTEYLNLAELLFVFLIFGRCNA